MNNYATDQGVLNAQHNAVELACRVEEQRIRPFMLLRPKIFKDGNAWCALLGENIAVGVVGFGDTPEDAAKAFDEAWKSP